MDHIPPAVTRLANHVMTIEDDDPQDRYERHGKIITMKKQ